MNLWILGGSVAVAMMLIWLTGRCRSTRSCRDSNVNAHDQAASKSAKDLEVDTIKERFVKARTVGLERTIMLNELIRETCAVVKKYGRPA